MGTTKGSALLRRAMDEKGLTLTQVAARADVTENTIRRALKEGVSRGVAVRVSRAIQELAKVEIPVALLRKAAR